MAGTVIRGKLKAAILPGLLVFVIHVFVAPVNRGLAILACIPLCMACAWVLFQAGQIRVEHAERREGREKRRKQHMAYLETGNGNRKTSLRATRRACTRGRRWGWSFLRRRSFATERLKEMGYDPKPCGKSGGDGALLATRPAACSF